MLSTSFGVNSTHL